MLKDLKLLTFIGVAFVIFTILYSLSGHVSEEISEESDFSLLSYAVNFTQNDTRINTSTAMPYEQIASMNVYNNTGGALNYSVLNLVDPTNYTYDAERGTFYLTALVFDHHNFTIDLNHYNRTTAWNVAKNTSSGLNKIAAYFPLLGILCIGGVLIALVLAAFRKTR